MSPSAPLSERLRLIVVTDAGLAAPRSVLDVVRAALAAGAPAIQLRDKHATAAELVETGRELRVETHRAGALLFVNDRLDVALAIEADGIHVGPDDIPVAALRRVAPQGFLLGASSDDPGSTRRLVESGADYIGCGTVYPTSTKADAGSTIGLDGLQAVASAVSVPVVGIGGIDADRATEVARHTDAAGVAVVGAVMRAPDIERVVTALLAPFSTRP